MSLARFSIVVAVDAGNGMAKNGDMPWTSPDDMKFFKTLTVGKRRNAVVMGRGTYESIPLDYRPLEFRKCVVISRTWKQEDHPNILVYPSLGDALAGLGGNASAYDDIFVSGGEAIYGEAVRDYLYLCNKIYVTKFKNDYNCDQFFPYDTVCDFPMAADPVKTREFTRYTFSVHPSFTHPEYEYLRVLEKVKTTGEPKPDRTGKGVLSLFGERMEFDISQRLPVLTTKKTFYNLIVKELLFFISGKTDTRILENDGVNIWKGNTSKEYLKSVGLDYLPGDMGPGYGYQWRHWGAPYQGCDVPLEGDTNQGIDQLSNLIEGIRNNPHDRRHILSAWNVSQLKEMALPPCHMFAQFYVSSDKKWLDCQLYQRSADMFLGVPFNITSYSLLTYMIAHITGLRPRRFVHILGDAHIYNNHIEQVNRQLKRTPRPFPVLSFREATRLQEIDDFKFDSFIIEGYTSWPAITAEMAI